MEYFAISTWKKILDATGKAELFFSSDHHFKDFVEHYSRIIEELSILAPKELEAYLAIQTCRSYKELADFILNREGKSVSEKEYKKLLLRLPPRASRGRSRIISELKKIYQEKLND